MKFIKKRLDKQSKVLFKNSSWIFLANVFATLLAFLRSIVIARGLGAEVFGTYLIVVAFVGTVQEFFNLNVSIAIIKFGAEYKAQNRIDKLIALVKGCLKANIIGAGISVLVITTVALLFYDKYFHHNGLEWFIIGFAIAESTSFLNAVSRSLLRLYYKFKMNSVVQMVMDIVEFTLISIAVWIAPKNLTMFFIMVIVSRLFNTGIINAAAFWELRHEFKPFLNAKLHLISEEFKTIRTFVIHNSISNTLKTLKDKGDLLLLGALTGTMQVANYSIAKRLAYSLLTITDPLTNSIFPQLSTLVAEKQNWKIKRMLSRLTLLSLVPSVIFLVIAYFIKDWVIIKMYGSEYAGAGLPFFFLLISAVQGSIFFWNVSLMQSLGLVRYRLVIYIYSIIIGMVLAFILIPTMQSTGMAIGLLITNFFINFSFIFIANRKLSEPQEITVA